MNKTEVIIILTIAITGFIILLGISNRLRLETKYELNELECLCVKMNYGKWVPGKDNKPIFQLITNNIPINN